MSLHFTKGGHMIFDEKVQVIKRLQVLEDKSSTITFRKCRERFWMWALRTLKSKGNKLIKLYS